MALDAQRHQSLFQKLQKNVSHMFKSLVWLTNSAINYHMKILFIHQNLRPIQTSGSVSREG